MQFESTGVHPKEWGLWQLVRRERFSWKGEKRLIKISVGSIPNSRNVLFLQIFLKRAAKPSAGNPVEPVEPDLTPHQRFPKPSPGPSLQPSPEPIEPDLALHQGFLEPSPEPSPEPC